MDRRKNPPVRDLRLRRAVLAEVPNFRAQRFAVLECDVAMRALALRLDAPGAARQPGVAHSAIDAEMSGDREVVHSANGG